ncbi:MAG: hypothetical protein IKF54_04885 [Eubacterium sp.]|nr:hypothetical protein [Eubacterium sp.]
MSRREIRRRRAEKAAKIIVITLGIGAVTGAILALSLHGVIKKVFVNEKWPGEEWSSDDWAEEELEN